MNDPFKGQSSGIDGPATTVLPVVPSDTQDLPVPSRAINVAEGGALRITALDGSVATLHIASGIPFPVRARRIWATGTTATGCVVLY